MSVQYSGDAATTRTSLGLGDAATKTTGTASGNIPVLDGSGQIASGVLSNAAVADNAITLAKMAHGTDGELITYDATGAPANVAVGTSGQVLTSGGVGVAPTFQTAAGGGKLLGVTSIENSTRISLSASADVWTHVTGSFTVTATTSDLIVFAHIPAKGNASGHCGVGIKIDSTYRYGSFPFDSTGWALAQDHHYNFGSGWSVGSHTISWGWKTGSASSEKPYNIINPNSTDDSRLQQTTSTITVMEVA